MRKLGKYEVLGELGHGAMGVVYRARDPIINRMVALKTITTRLAEDPNLLQRFYREAQAAGGLQHPNIVTIYDMGDEQNTPYIAMELIQGESLEDMIARRKSVPLALKLTYALQACRALDYAHKRGIVHRDIKPANVMVNKESIVKVVDFGIARVLDTSKTQTGMLIGTFAYMSPEQYSGEHADERSDIWSFGVLLYELLCYQRPFVSESPASLMHSICSQQQRPLTERVTDCPPAMESIICKILQKAPEDRFQSMEDVLLELEPVHKELQMRSMLELINQSRQLIGQSEFTQARELLREPLKVDPTNAQARALLEKVNAELKRLSNRPKAQQQVDKGRSLLREGKIQEARAEAENALQLDSSFEPARELQEQIQRELERAQMVAEWLQASGQRLAEGKPDEAEELLAKVFLMEPANQQAKDLRQQVLIEKAERQRRLRLLDKMQEARGLWSQLHYDGCIGILSELQKEFPGEEEIQRLMDTVREDQAEQYKHRTLDGARSLLAAGNYAQGRALLVHLQTQFPTDEEIATLLEELRLDEAKQRRLQRLAEARIYLANGQYQESIAALIGLDREFRDDREILQLLDVARADQAEQQRQQGLAQARTLLAARQYDQCMVLLAKLQRQFPNDNEILELQRAIREEQAKQHKQQRLAKARSLFAAKQFEESITLLTELQKEFPADEEILKLLTTVQGQQQRQKGIAAVRSLLTAQRYEECKVLLAELLEQFPGDSEVLELQSVFRAGQAEQERQRGIAEAKNLLAAHRYEECHALLTKLGRQFPNDSDIGQLERAAREGQREQRKQEDLARARSLLRSRNYDESIALLTGIEREFPSDPQVRQLLKTALQDQAEQQKEQGIAEVQNLLEARRYEDCAARLAKLQKQFPDDSEILQLMQAVQGDKAEHEKLEGLAAARTLLANRNYEECLALLMEIGKRFPDDQEIRRLTATARDGLAEQRKLKGLTEARSLLRAGRYNESIALLRALTGEFPEAGEIARLLLNTQKEQAEQQKQQKLAEGRALLAAQLFSQALQLLDGLHAAYPKDTAVQKLRALVEREREKQSRAERLQRELETLKKLVSEKKYSELLAQAEPLKAEFPTNGDLLRLIDFARSQQARIESENRLRAAIDNAKAQLSAGRFADAFRAADAGLQAFPQHAELVYLREQAETREKKQRTRGMIEQRIREIKFKINRENYSDAIGLAKETLATLGPDTDLTQLLNSATAELQARDTKRQQEQKLQKIRTLMESGSADEAAQTLRDALKTDALDPFDPRVSRVSQEIEAAKNPSPVVPATGVHSAPANFSKEYAFLQGRPVEAEPAPTENIGFTPTGTAQASATQAPVSSQPTAPMPPPAFAGIAPAVAAPKRAVQPAPVRQPVKEIVTPPAVAQPRFFARKAMLAATGIGLILGVWAIAHLVSQRETEESGIRMVQPHNGPNPPQPKSTQPAAKIDPLEAQQREALNAASKLIAENDLDAARDILQKVATLQGPLSPEIQKMREQVDNATHNKVLGELLLREERLWQKALDEFSNGRFPEARQSFRQVLALSEGGRHRTEARQYLDVSIPNREKEERLFQEAQQAQQRGNKASLQRALGQLEEVKGLGGSRQQDAQEMQTAIRARLDQMARDEQSASLLSSARQDLKRNDFRSARQKATQVSQLGDAGPISAEIDQEEQKSFNQLEGAYNRLLQADDESAEQQLTNLLKGFQSLADDAGGPRAADARKYVVKLIPEATDTARARAATKKEDVEFQRAVQNYQAANPQDRSALERALSAFLAIAGRRGRHAEEAQDYAAEVNNKVAALKGPTGGTGPSSLASDRQAIQSVLDRYSAAFDQKSLSELREIWPSLGKKEYDNLERTFRKFDSIHMELRLNPPELAADGTSSAVTGTFSQSQVSRDGESRTKGNVSIRLRKKNGVWFIDSVEYVRR